MHIIDSHFHYWPTSVFDWLLKRSDYPKAVPNDRGAWTYIGTGGRSGTIASWPAWYDLEKEFEHMDKLGHQVDVVSSIGPLSVAFSELPVETGREARRCRRQASDGRCHDRSHR